MSSTSDCGNIQDCSATDHVAEPDLSMLSQNDIGQLSEIFHLLGTSQDYESCFTVCVVRSL